MNYVLLIERQNHCTFEEVNQHLKTTFKSGDHLEGFCEGYLFGKFKLMTLAKYQEEVNSIHSPWLEKYWLVFVTVSEEGED